MDIFEDDETLTIVADMPGIPSENVSIDLQEDVLTLTGIPSLALPEKEEFVLQEFDTGKYFRQFKLSEVIDQVNVKTKLDQGVLRVTLPKSSQPNLEKLPSPKGKMSKISREGERFKVRPPLNRHGALLLDRCEWLDVQAPRQITNPSP